MTEVNVTGAKATGTNATKINVIEINGFTRTDFVDEDDRWLNLSRLK